MGDVENPQDGHTQRDAVASKEKDPQEDRIKPKRASIKDIVGILKLAQEDLAEEKEQKCLVTTGFERITQAIRMLNALETQAETSVEKRLQKVENAINGITARTAQGSKSWAVIAAKP